MSHFCPLPPCHYGVTCRNPACKFTHPCYPDRVPRNITICASMVKGEPCSHSNCKYPHKKSMTLCKFWVTCRMPSCPFLHPKDIPKPTPAPHRRPPPMVLCFKRFWPGGCDGSCGDSHTPPRPNPHAPLCRNGPTCGIKECTYNHTGSVTPKPPREEMMCPDPNCTGRPMEQCPFKH